VRGCEPGRSCGAAQVAALGCRGRRELLLASSRKRGEEHRTFRAVQGGDDRGQSGTRTKLQDALAPNKRGMAFEVVCEDARGIPHQVSLGRNGGRPITARLRLGPRTCGAVAS